MLRPATLGFILACAVSLSSSGVVLDNGMPILWTQAVSQLNELPTQDGTVTPNPWHYPNRLSFYRLLIAATDPFMGYMGSSPTDNPLWGLALELGWMLASGRLADPTGSTTCGLQTGDTTCISPQSWWSCVSHFTSALPFLSAAQQGFMGADVQVQLQAPAGSEGYCTTYTECSTQYPDAMAKWDAYFQAVKASTDSPSPDNEKKDSVLGAYWAAQMASLYASAACNTKQSHYSSEEVAFANSWMNAAEYVSAAHFHSSLDKSVQFLIPLPSRVLKDGDVAPNIADLTQEENHSLSVFSWMRSVNTLLGGTLVNMWKGAMCSVATREKGREMLEQLLLNPSYATTSFLSLITGLTTSC